MNMQEPIADSARAAMKILLADNEPLEVAELVGVHNAHVYKCRASGRISPTLKKALVKRGYIPSKKRHRLHYECGRGAEGKAKRDQLKDEIEWADCESFTEYVDYLREFGYR